MEECASAQKYCVDAVKGCKNFIKVWPFAAENLLTFLIRVKCRLFTTTLLYSPGMRRFFIFLVWTFCTDLFHLRILFNLRILINLRILFYLRILFNMQI